MFPNFLGIGAQRAGTTWLHAALSSHDEFWLPHLKELHYFDHKFPMRTGCEKSSSPNQRIIAKQMSAKRRRFLADRVQVRGVRDVAWELRYLFGRWDDEWYASLFEQAGGRIAGEITPAYLCLSEAAIAHVYALMPDVRLVLLLRDPVQRAWSHAKMDLARHMRREWQAVPHADFSAHFRASASRLRGDYVSSIERWLGRFPPSQLLIAFYDEIEEQPRILMQRVLDFLGASVTDADKLASISTRFNTGELAAIPATLHRELAELYVEQTRVLAQRFGKYPQRWLEASEAVLA